MFGSKALLLYQKPILNQMKFYKIKNESFFTPKILRTFMQIVPSVSDTNTLVDFEVHVVLRYYA